MAVLSNQVTVTTTATEIYTNNTGSARHIHIHNPTGGQAVFVGPAGVTTTTGLNLASSDRQLDIMLHPGDVLYGVVTATTQAISFIVT